MALTNGDARRFLALAAFFGLTGVALGAFGAHGLRAYFEANPSLESSYDTAVQYQLIHAAVLLAVACLAALANSRWVRFAGWLFAAGIILFSGSLYLLSLFNIRFMGAAAPLGGLALIGGWLCIGLAAWRAKPAAS